MPCRREEEEEAGDEAEGEEDDDSFLLLQQSVTVGGSADVDRLIAQIGETLQLDPAHDGRASPWHLGESSSGGGPQAERARATTTRTGSCSSSCSRETSSRRRCAGSSGRLPRSPPRARRAPRAPGVAEADRTQSPCSPREPGSDPGALEEEKRTRLRRFNSFLPRTVRS